MGRGILLGIGWGVMVAGLAGTALSLIYSNDNAAPTAVTAAEQAAPAPENVAEAADAFAAPSVDTAQTSSQGEDMQDASAQATSVPAATDSPAKPAASEMAQSDVQPDDADAASNTAPTTAPIAAPDVMTPEMTGAAPDAGQDEVPVGSSEASISPDSHATQPEALQTEMQSETQPEVQTGEVAMTPPPMQDGPDMGGGAELGSQETGRAPDVPDVAEVAMPDASPPIQPDSAQPDSKLAEMPAVPAAPEKPEPEATKPESTEPESTEPESAEPESAEPESAAPESAGQFDSARTPVPKMANLAPNVKTNRLPTIGGSADLTEATVEAAAEAAEATDARALVAHAMAFENPEAKPMFSVILIDDPEYPISDDVLSHLPFALSFAIDAVRDDAHAVAARYRAAGFEVLMLTNLPFGASPTDVEVAFGAYSRAIPEAIGVLDLGANGFLRGPSTATQIAGIMSEHGYGLITPSKGLNSAQKAAMREGVLAVLLFRELDAEGEKPSVIRRYLDRAAFRAAQEGSVIMLGHSRPDTIEALVTWALEDRAASVAIAPVSAVMLAQ